MLNKLKSHFRPRKKQATMDPSMAKALRNIEILRKSSHPWERKVPYEQPYYSFSPTDNAWQAVERGKSPGLEAFADQRFTVLSWNIDFMRPLAEARMTAALQHLDLLFRKAQSPCVIFLQEMVAKDLDLIRKQPWIQSSFNLTDISEEYWESGYYGTCTLVSKLLPITSVFRVHYDPTDMERDALFVDVSLESGKVLRLCNTHLESLPANPPKRPKQMQTAAEHMHDAQVQASVLGGDLNAIQDFDDNLHVDNNLQDAYLATGGQKDAESGMTWGQMARTIERGRFGLTRMDKLLFCGDIHAERFENFGMGVEVAREEDRQRLMHEGLEAGWVTDHLGVQAQFRLLESAQVA